MGYAQPQSPFQSSFPISTIPAPAAAAIIPSRVKEFGIEKRISDRPHAMSWLFKTYALSAGMYASQIWSTQFLKHDNGFSNPLQAHMAFLKRMLGIKSTSANWCVLRECAQEPLQFYWFRSAIKFWNRMVDSNNNTRCYESRYFPWQFWC